MKVLFIDLDRTLIETKSGKDFANEAIDDWKFKDGILDKLVTYIENDYQIHVVTNQGGVAAGYIKPTEIVKKIDNIVKELFYFYNMTSTIYYQASGHVGIREAISVSSKKINISVFPSLSSQFRKPNTDWIIGTYSTLDKDNSLMVGDASGLLRKKKVDRLDINNNEYIDLNNPANAVLNKDGIKKFEEAGYIYDRLDNIWYLPIRHDHSDDDKKFAENLGIKYIDIEEFLK